MLKVKHLTLFKPVNWKKGGNFCNLVSRFSLILTTFLLSNETFEKVFFIFSSKEESKCKNAQFVQCILKDDDVYFLKITAF